MSPRSARRMKHERPLKADIPTAPVESEISPPGGDIPADEPLPMAFESPESSSIAGATYDPLTQVLTVSFRGQSTYAYAGVEPQLWRDLLMAESKGTFFAHIIRPFYSGRKL